MTGENRLLSFYNRCLNADYTLVENGGDYAVEIDAGDPHTAYLLFQWSNGNEDWKNNFDFAAVPYKDMETPWRCHRGFLRVWKSIEPYIAEVVANERIKHFIIIGYSHGAAIATLAHEYVWFNRPDLRPENSGSYLSIEGYGFGCPRVFWGRMRIELRERWLSFFAISNLNDIVPHLPPVLFGFRHVNQVWKIGKKENQVKHRRLSCLSSHYPDNYIRSLESM